ncbi:hypothetical protein N7478_010804 [Penicillium angulare]|uniref:uncharacterized protein n=1 Tax=Penicillium angulare TaxID=116970 RepID=UPI00253FD5ED|nr:uncharacterized protein N7478_010804 [Penicillium angulare]KAJ5263199.1 hypothetical protein N7478_010804 [Penicillium angulare]
MDDPKPKKLTLSCSRCRTAKLKCDRKEPCLECIKRDCAHLCTKDVRQPRAKRTKTQQTEQKDNQVNSKKEEQPEVEETALALEHFVDVTPFRTESEGVAPDIPNPYWVTQSPHRDKQKFELIRDVIQTLPEWDVIQTLYEIFVIRCQGPLGNVVHTPSFMKQADQLSQCLNSPYPDAAIATTIPLDSLAVLLLALVLGLAFHPTPSLIGFQSTPQTSRVEQLRASEESTSTWRFLGLRCLRGSISVFCGSIASLQAAVMLLLDAKESSIELDALIVTAIAGARKLGLHQLGNAALNDSSPSNDGPAIVESRIRTEIAIRIWWALVMRDWSRGQALGYYTIRPSQFNTRMPLHLNDEDIYVENGIPIERPRSEFTMLSYTVHALELSVIVRESIDLKDAGNEAARQRQDLNRKYENYVANLPSYFRLGSTVGITAVGPMAGIPPKRFMLHQQLWSLLLRLHRSNIISPMGRAFCQQLAHNIISTQVQIQSRCAVCGSLSSNETQIFSATVVLVLGLLFSNPSTEVEQSSAQLSRLMTRDQIREAIELLRTRGSPKINPEENVQLLHSGASRGVLALEALMKLEERSGSSFNRDEGESQNHSLYHQVVGILKTLNGSLALSTHIPSLSTPGDTPLTFSMPATDEFSDLDVMPILSNGMTPDMWDLLDFYPPDDEDNFKSAIASWDLPE